MHVKLRYVERRVDHSGAERWYWHRHGHKLARLPDNPIERMAVAERLNAAADSLAPTELARHRRQCEAGRQHAIQVATSLAPVASPIGTANCARAATIEHNARGAAAMRRRPAPAPAGATRVVNG
jgi:hypothetical protein